MKLTQLLCTSEPVITTSGEKRAPSSRSNRSERRRRPVVTVTVVSAPTGCNRSLNYFQFQLRLFLLDRLLISSVSKKNIEMVHVWKRFSAALPSLFSPSPHSSTSSESHLFYFPPSLSPISPLSSVCCWPQIEVRSLVGENIWSWWRRAQRLSQRKKKKGKGKKKRNGCSHTHYRRH